MHELGGMENQVPRATNHIAGIGPRNLQLGTWHIIPLNVYTKLEADWELTETETEREFDFNKTFRRFFCYYFLFFFFFFFGSFAFVVFR